MTFGDYIIYVDESGDHSLAKINPQNPVFVLVFCIFEKQSFLASVVPAVQKLKFEFWGHDGIVLHSHEIRKAHGDFNILLNSEIRARFIERICQIVELQPFTVIAAVIDKPRLNNKYFSPGNPYELALTFCMERLQHWLIEKKQEKTTTHLMIEKRGRTEDSNLELQFRRVVAGQNSLGPMPNLDIRFMDKKHNSTGLQIADLIAHPVGRHVINPKQPNRSYALIQGKFRKGPNGKIAGYGLKVFP